MSFAAYSPEVRSIFAFWQVLRQLGWTSEEVFVGLSTFPVVGQATFLQIHIDNVPRFSMTVSRTTMTHADFEREWLRLCVDVEDFSQAILKANHDRYVRPDHYAAILHALDASGLCAPHDPRKELLN